MEFNHTVKAKTADVKQSLYLAKINILTKHRVLRYHTRNVRLVTQRFLFDTKDKLVESANTFANTEFVNNLQ